MLPLGEDVTVRVGTDANGEILLDGNTMEGFFASDHYTDESPYGFALVLTGSRWTLVIVLIAASLSSLEELVIECRAEQWAPDRRGLWEKR